MERLLSVIEDQPLAREIQERLGLSNRKHLREQYLRPALTAGLLETTLPEKPNSSQQRYRLTAEGVAWLAWTQ